MKRLPCLLRESIAEGWPPTRGRSHFVTLLEFLSRIQPGGATGLNGALESYAALQRGQKGKTVFVPG